MGSNEINHSNDHDNQNLNGNITGSKKDILLNFDPDDRKTYMEKYVNDFWKINNVNDIDLTTAKNPYYNLMMFPYPSAEGMHIGNFYAYTGADVNGRFHRLKGYDLFEPMGFDSFGIHTENFALSKGMHPKLLTEQNIENFRKQFDLLGANFNWNYSIITSSPEYYKWNQKIFIDLYNAGLVYKKISLLNWCSKCKTVISDEQVENGRCERHSDTLVEKKETEQWFLRLSDFADDLYNRLDTLDRSEKTKNTQKNWIGLIEGFSYQMKTTLGEDISIFFKDKNDINYTGAVYVSPDSQFVKGKIDESEISTLINENKFQKSLKRSILIAGQTVRHPITNEELPIYVTNEYTIDDGYEFTYKKDSNNEITESGKEDIEMVKIKKYKLRDWCVSRQRYWGTPIPMVYCDDCGLVPENEENLPIRLPDIEKTEPTGDIHGPLANIDEFINTECPCCKGPAKRESDVLDNFFDSSWFFFRYLSPDSDQLFDNELVKKMMPLDAYIGGNEHAVLHLLYTRFMTKAFQKLGLIDFDEPFKKFFAHGLIIKDGMKMSKSKGNVINPDEYIAQYGSDSLRMYLMFLGPLADGGDFSDAGIKGVYKFTNKIQNHLSNIIVEKHQDNNIPSNVRVIINKIIKGYENFKYNVSVAGLMERYNSIISKKKSISEHELKRFLTLLAPLCPFLSEYIWLQHDNTTSIYQQEGDNMQRETIESMNKEKYVIQVNGKFIKTIEVDENKELDEIIISLQNDAEIKRKIANIDEITENNIVFIKGKVLNILQ